MGTLRTVDLRTVALVGHGASGKTTLAEALLAKSGMIGAPGSVERGSTVSDHDPLEKTHRHSLRAAICHVDYKGTRVHLIDTPGYPDFVGQALGALDAVETVAVVVSATGGIELATRRMMEAARERNLCRLVVVNKIDHENIDLPGLLAELQQAFGAEVLPINLPAERGARVIDCFASDRGEADFLSVAEVHRKLLEQVVEVDDDAMNRYLEQGDVDPTTLHAPLEKALREGHLVPVCFVSARTGAGVLDLLEVMTRHLPHPGEGNPPQFVRAGVGERAGDESAAAFHSEPDPSRHVLAHVFKVVIDPYVGKIGVFRVHQGTITPNTQLYVGSARRAFKVNHLFALQGKETVEVDSLAPGDIGAIAKVDEVAFDCVLHDSHDEDLVRMRPLDFPKPMVGLALEPKRRGDEARVSDVLARMAAEDPTLLIEHDVTQNETVLRGLSELHLRTVLERMSSLFKLEVQTRPPRVPYRETNQAAAEGHARHKKQTGGAGQFGEVFLRIEPLGRGEGFEFVDRVKGGVIPHPFIPAVEKGVREVYAAGYLAGYPMQDVRVIVHDGKHHPVDSKEIAFIAAGRKAFVDALARSQPILLEPIVEIQIVCGDGQVGDVAGDLASRRGQVNGSSALAGGRFVLRGTVPLAELDGYAGRLKALTQGQGSYAIELARYDPVPPGVQQRLVQDYKPGRRDDES